MNKTYPRIKSARQLKPIKTRSFSSLFPIGSRITLDKKNVIAKKEHQILWQSGAYYGEVGDMCDYVSHEELFELHEKGYIRLEFC
jgi:hypothetical protein